MKPSAKGLVSRLSSLWAIGVFLILFATSAILINGKPIGLAQLKEITGGVSIPDMDSFGYSSQRLYSILDGQGAVGRSFYLHNVVPQDFPFPLFYSLFYAATLTYLARKVFPNRRIWTYIGLIGLSAGFMDWCENLSLLRILLSYPMHLSGWPSLASSFTILKTILIYLNIAMILVGLALLARSVLLSRRKLKNVK